MGTTAEQLESIKELIQFDHVYHKSVPENGKSEGTNFTSKIAMDTNIEESSVQIEPETCEVVCIDSPKSINNDEDMSDEVVFLCSRPKTVSPSWSEPEATRWSKVNSNSVDSRDSDLMDCSNPKGSLQEDALSDAGYESASSLLSPYSDHEATLASPQNDCWDNSLAELFPSLL